MTRSHKQNDRDHVGLADGTAEPEAHLPRYFAKSGFADADPTKTKKNGGGRANWGLPGDELEDIDHNMTNPRRRSNSSTHGHSAKDFKTKFETVEQEPVFEEELHGAPAQPPPEGPITASLEELEDGASTLNSTTSRSSDSSADSSASRSSDDVVDKKSE